MRNLAGWGLLVSVALSFLVVSLFVSPRRLLVPLKSALRLVFRAFGLRVRLAGLERLDPARTYLFVFNHTNVLDHLILLAHLPGYFVGLEATEAARIPVYGWAGRRWGQIRIDRGSPEAARHACRLVAERLASGTNVAVCPEGRHTRDGRLGEFKKGAFHIAVDSRATVVPIALIGLHALMPHPRKSVGAGDLVIDIGVPLPPPEPGPDAHETLLKEARAVIARALGEDPAPAPMAHA